MKSKKQAPEAKSPDGEMFAILKTLRAKSDSGNVYNKILSDSVQSAYDGLEESDREVIDELANALTELKGVGELSALEAIAMIGQIPEDELRNALRASRIKKHRRRTSHY